MRRTRLKHFTLNMILASVLIGYFLVPGILSAQEKLYDDLFSVSFPNENDGWACGRWGTVLHTSNGGKTWVHQKTGLVTTLISIYFVDPKNGWAVGDQGTIIHTKDGGKNWEKQKSPISFYLMGVCFVNASKGWIVTERTHILFTDDGGKNWSIQFKDEDYVLKAVSFCDPNNGWAVGEFGYTYHTKDGGVTWEKQFGKFGMSEETGDIESDPMLFSVMAVNPQTAWAVGIEGFVINTTDGGKTWKQANTGVPKIHLFSVTSDGKGAIMTAGNRSGLISADNGRTWKTMVFDPPITYNWIYGIAQRGPSGFIAVGSEGAIYRSDSITNPWKRVLY
jgi:hypothetical protein